MALTVDIGPFTASSLLVAFTVVAGLAGSIAYAVRSFRSDAVEVWKNVAEGHEAQAKRWEAAFKDEANRSHELEDAMHAAEKVVLEKDAEIARLEQRPSTDQLQQTLVDQHQETLEALSAMNNATLEMGKGITRLLERNHMRRKTDPKR